MALDEHRLDPRPAGRAGLPGVLVRLEPGGVGTLPAPQGRAGRGWRAGQPGRDWPSGAAGPAGPGRTCGAPGPGGNGDQPQGFSPYLLGSAQPQTAARAMPHIVQDEGRHALRPGNAALVTWINARPRSRALQALREQLAPSGTDWTGRVLASVVPSWRPAASRANPGRAGSAWRRWAALAAAGTGWFGGHRPPLAQIRARSLVICYLDHFTGEVYQLGAARPAVCGWAISLDWLFISGWLLRPA